MEDFQVPQFIEDESKLVGPFSFVQIFILVIGIGLAILIYNIFIKIISIPIALVVFFLTLVLALGKVHEFPMYKMVVHIVKHFVLPKSYLWKQPKIKASPLNKKDSADNSPLVFDKGNNTPVNSEKIQELSKLLDRDNE